MKTDVTSARCSECDMRLRDWLEFHPAEACSYFKRTASPTATRQEMQKHPRYVEHEKWAAEVRARIAKDSIDLFPAEAV